MRKVALALVIVALGLIPFGGPAHGRDRPFGAADLISMKWAPSAMEKDLAGGAGQTDPGGQFSVSQIEQFRCASGGNPDRGRRHQLQHDAVQPGLESRQRDRGRRRPGEPGSRRRRIERLLLSLQQPHRRPPGARADRLLHLVRRRRDVDRRSDPDALGQRRRRSVTGVRRRARRRRSWRSSRTGWQRQRRS